MAAERLAQHYRGEPWNIVGSLTLDIAGMGKELVLDIDAHDGQAHDAAANLRFAAQIWRVCNGLGVTALVYGSNGKGGVHVRVGFARLMPGWKLRRFGFWLVRGWKDAGVLTAPEVFPKQDRPGSEGCGNYVRLPGKHHKRDYWPEVFDGQRGLTGSAAVDHVIRVLSNPNDPARIPGPKGSRATGW
ncbi:MAG TPA: hypothetical protein VM533_19955 [Fimbriiglobus sp.]|nr:hypothetical protein [Fimbriiglobus sp.]